MRLGGILWAALAGGLALLAGCDSPKAPPPREYLLISPYLDVRTLAVAPAVNQSGSRDFDPLTVSDQLFAELQQVQGLQVLPVNKALAAMQRLQMRAVDSPAAARALAEAVGADALVVPVVTAYDPYSPPVVGMALQMYTARAWPAGGAEAGRGGEPSARQIDGASLAGTVPAGRAAGAREENKEGGGREGGPVAQVSAIFNASNQSVREELRNFARGRTNYESALQEQQFLADSDAYVRFVCHAMVRRLMEVERGRADDR